MTIEELRQLSEIELKRLVQESRDKLRDLRFKLARREVKNVKEAKEIRKIIARIMTLLKSKLSK